jgi:hypothetical protein
LQNCRIHVCRIEHSAVGRATCFLAAVVVMLATTVAAQVNVTGDWAVEFSTSYGTGVTTMSIVQEGTSIAGFLSTERSEVQVKGTMQGDKFRVVWEQPVEGKIVRITFEAVVQGRTMTGTVRFGDLADGPFYAEQR